MEESALSVSQGVLDQTGTSLTEQQGFRSPAQAQDTPVRAALARREES